MRALPTSCPPALGCARCPSLWRSTGRLCAPRARRRRATPWGRSWVRSHGRALRHHPAPAGLRCSSHSRVSPPAAAGGLGHHVRGWVGSARVGRPMPFLGRDCAPGHIRVVLLGQTPLGVVRIRTALRLPPACRPIDGQPAQGICHGRVDELHDAHDRLCPGRATQRGCVGRRGRAMFVPGAAWPHLSRWFESRWGFLPPVWEGGTGSRPPAGAAEVIPSRRVRANPPPPQHPPSPPRSGGGQGGAKI